MEEVPWALDQRCQGVEKGEANAEVGAGEVVGHLRIPVLRPRRLFDESANWVGAYPSSLSWLKNVSI